MWWVEQLFYHISFLKSPNYPDTVSHALNTIVILLLYTVVSQDYFIRIKLCQINFREINCVTACFIFIRGVGCIFYEMACGRPLFPGSTVEDELYYIFKILGTPTEENFPGISKNEEFLSYNFSQYESENLINVAPR